MKTLWRRDEPLGTMRRKVRVITVDGPRISLSAYVVGLKGGIRNVPFVLSTDESVEVLPLLRGAAS